MKLIISSGDSFTFGAELESDNPMYPNPNSWSGLVAKRFCVEHINTARSSRGNSYIARQIIHQTTCALEQLPAQEIFVLAMWSFSNRHEFALAQDFSAWDSPWFGLTPYTAEDESRSDWFSALSKSTPHYEPTRLNLKQTWKRNHQLGMVDFAQQFVAKIQGRALHDSYTTASEILRTQDFLDQRNVGYLFTYVDQHAWNGIHNDAKQDPGSHYLASTRQQIKFDQWYHFPGHRGFKDWALQNNYEFATSHPLEPAHQAAANLIYTYITEKEKQNAQWKSLG